MRVLHLPTNIASQITTTVHALRDNGIEARGVAFARVITSNQEIEPLPVPQSKQLIPRVISGIHRRLKILQVIQWADVVHWHSHWALSHALDVKWASWLGKKRVVEFWGSEIRIPEVEMADNPYYAAFLKQSSDAHRFGSLQKSRSIQQQFAAFGVTPLVSDAQMLAYIQPDLFPKVQKLRQRIYLPDYKPQFPSPSSHRPRIVHSPSSPLIKGTPAVQTAVAQLQGKSTFDFQLIQGMPHQQAKAIMQECDIFVDQLILGTHGLAALEAMAYGKPVICYIKPSMVSTYPAELPIVSATVENLPEVLARLLEDSQLRYELGRRGRAYVEKYHDAHRLAQDLVDIYRVL